MLRIKREEKVVRKPQKHKHKRKAKTLRQILKKVSPHKQEQPIELGKIPDLKLIKSDERLLKHLLPKMVNVLARNKKATEAMGKLDQKLETLSIAEKKKEKKKAKEVKKTKEKSNKPWYRRAYSFVKRGVVNIANRIWESPTLTFVVSIILLFARQWFCQWLSRNAYIVPKAPSTTWAKWFEIVLHHIKSKEQESLFNWISSNTLKVVGGIGFASLAPSLIIALIGPLIVALVKFICSALLNVDNVARSGTLLTFLWSVLSTCYERVKYKSSRKGSRARITDSQKADVEEFLNKHGNATQSELNQFLKGLNNFDQGRSDNASGTKGTW